MGEDGGPRLYDPHARLRLGGKSAAQPASARFRVPPSGHFLQAMLDYILVSPALAALNPVWRIWHPFDDAECYADARLRAGLLAASDPFPVSLDIDI